MITMIAVKQMKNGGDATHRFDLTNERGIKPHYDGRIINKAISLISRIIIKPSMAVSLILT